MLSLKRKNGVYKAFNEDIRQDWQTNTRNLRTYKLVV